MPIDRSIPLPIHEPAKTMIDRVAELKKLEAKATPCKWDRTEIDEIITDHRPNYIDSETYRANGALVCGLRNAAPAMLDVLKEIRAGDAEKLQVMADWFKQMPLLDEQWVRELLNRYQAMAAKMVAVCDEHAR
jgi:hypothetical protein